MTVQHRNIPDAQLHEVKGASSASDGSFLRGNGDGTASFQALNDKMGWWNLDDVATSSTPIALTAAGTRYDLTNDTLGVATINTYGLTDIDIWNESTNRFDFSQLEVGDTVDIRVDVDITSNAVNGVFNLDIEIGMGSPTNFILPINNIYYKSAGTYEWISPYSLFIGSTDIRDNPARLTMMSDSTGDTVVVNGWYVRVIKRAIGV